jgi:hypothetical protein
MPTTTVVGESAARTRRSPTKGGYAIAAPSMISSAYENASACSMP